METNALAGARRFVSSIHEHAPNNQQAHGAHYSYQRPALAKKRKAPDAQATQHAPDERVNRENTPAQNLAPGLVPSPDASPDLASAIPSPDLATSFAPMLAPFAPLAHDALAAILRGALEASSPDLLALARLDALVCAPGALERASYAAAQIARRLDFLAHTEPAPSPALARSLTHTMLSEARALDRALCALDCALAIEQESAQW